MAEDLTHLLNIYSPPAVTVLGRHNAAFAAELAAPKKSDNTRLPTIDELRQEVAHLIRGKELLYPPGMSAQSYVVEKIGGLDTSVLKAENSTNAPTLIMFYGGGFCLNTLNAHKAFMANVAKKKYNVLLPAYPLAPENKAPEIIAHSEKFLSAFLSNPNALGLSDRIILMGWSSGGNQALTVSLNLKKLVPNLFHKISQLILLSPWIDLSMRVTRQGPYQLQQNTDMIAAGPDLLSLMSQWYLPQGFKGTEADFCAVYRSINELKHLPPVTIIVGGSEVLLGDSIYLTEKLRQASVSVNLIVLEGQTHNYVVFHQLSLDGIFVPELIDDIITNKPIDKKIGADDLRVFIR